MVKQPWKKSSQVPTKCSKGTLPSASQVHPDPPMTGLALDPIFLEDEDDYDHQAPIDTSDKSPSLFVLRPDPSAEDMVLDPLAESMFQPRLIRHQKFAEWFTLNHISI